MHGKFPNLPLWVTEFASDSHDGNGESKAHYVLHDTELPPVVKDFMVQSLNFLDGAQYVERYSWFSYGVNALFQERHRRY